MNASDEAAPVAGDSVAEDAALPPEAMLALLDDQRRSVEGQMGAFLLSVRLSRLRRRAARRG